MTTVYLELNVPEYKISHILNFLLKQLWAPTTLSKGFSIAVDRVVYQLSAISAIFEV